jgi:hypothetical protein
MDEPKSGVIDKLEAQVRLLIWILVVNVIIAVLELVWIFLL